MVMGRKTWESLGRPLPGRAHIVVSSQENYMAEGATVVSSVSEGLRLAETMAEATGADEVMVIGGARIYQEAMPHADRIYLTEVHRDYEGDTLMPDWNSGSWHEVSREERDGDPAFAWITLDRK